MICEWYALCTNPADGLADHPTLGPVPCCQRCASKHSLVLFPLPADPAWQFVDDVDGPTSRRAL